MTNSRNKGAAAEREVFKILSLALGIKVERNLIQTRDGGADTYSIEGWAVEIKRQETLSLPAWWEQTLAQAVLAQKKPMLVYRQSRHPWRVRVLASDFFAAYGASKPVTGVLEMDLDMGIELMKLDGNPFK